MPAISDTGDITLSAELLLALTNNEFTPSAFRAFQEFKTLLAEYIACRDALDSVEVRLDCLWSNAQNKEQRITTKSAFLSDDVKTKLEAHQVQVKSVAKGRHPLNEALGEYQAHLQRVVDELGDCMLRPVPVGLSRGGRDLKAGRAEQKIEYHLVLMKRTIQRIYEGILEFDQDTSNRTLLNKNRQFMDDFLRPSTKTAKPQIKLKEKADEVPIFENLERLKRKRSETLSSPLQTVEVQPEASPSFPNYRRKRFRSPSRSPLPPAMWYEIVPKISPDEFDIDIGSDTASSSPPSDESSSIDIGSATASSYQPSNSSNASTTGSAC